MTVTLPEMVKEAERELALRRNVYPKWIKSGRLSQEKADQQITVMAAIVEYLKLREKVE